MRLSPILFVEDSRDDRELTLAAIERHKIRNRVDIAKNGEEALDYLFARGDFAKRDSSALPALILLDLKLPKISGLEVLKAIRANQLTKNVPVVIFTSSKEENDMIESYNLGANSFVQKPISFNAFAEAVRNLGVYWLLVNETPGQREG